MDAKIPVSVAVVALGLALPAVAAQPQSDAPAACSTAIVEAPTADVVFTAHGGCHVSTDCECGTIRCEGQTCSATSNSVTCDDETTTCPSPGSCSATTYCPDTYSYISCTSEDCTSGTRCTKEENCWVACDTDDDGFGLEDFTWCPGYEGCLLCPCQSPF